MVCTTCGLLSEPKEGNYCKYARHQTKFGKRLRTLILNDQSEYDTLDAGTYKVEQQNDSELLTAQEGEHPFTCICTKCMMGDEERSFESPYNQKWMMTDIANEIMTYINTDGMYGLDLYSAQTLERRIQRMRISNPEIKVGKKVKETLANGKVVYSLPIVSQKPVEQWMHWLPTVATKENLEACHPTLMKSMTKMGIMNASDRWARENWETFPWCESVTPKRMWNLICCDCNECKGCSHEFCKDTLQNHKDYVFKSNNPESLSSKRFNNAKHVLFTTRKIPENHHVEWDSWNGTSFVKDEVKKSVPQKTQVTDYQINTMRENGIECPTWYSYQDAYKIMGMIFKHQIGQAKTLVESMNVQHEHMKTHEPFPDFEPCIQCNATYYKMPSQDPKTEEWSYMECVTMPLLKGIEVRHAGPLCDLETGNLAFNEDGALTYKKYNVGVVGVSKIPTWRVPFFKREVEKVLNTCIETYGITHLTIVSGGAEGVDSIVEEMCKARGIDFKVYLPDVDSWQDHGKQKGFRTRNLEIVAKATCKIINLVGATKEPNCYHCSDTYTCKCGSKRKTSHWHSGGCWTMKQAENRGTSTELIEVA